MSTSVVSRLGKSMMERRVDERVVSRVRVLVCGVPGGSIPVS